MVELFEQYKKDKIYDQANEVYLEAIRSGRSRSDSDEMLKLKTSLADMPVAQRRCEEAEDIINDISMWEDLPSALETHCKEIRGKILCSRKRYNEAEDWYRKLYYRASNDEWSLNMRDQMRQAISSQGDYDLAQLEQVKVWENRKKSLGKDHPSTMKSTIMVVEFLSKLIQKIPTTDGSNGGRAEKRKLAYETEIEYILYDIWTSMAKHTQKQEASMLRVGHDLGMSLSDQGKEVEAEKILAKVWQGRTFKLREFNRDTMSSGISLSQAMYLQEPRKCSNAIQILEAIHASGTTQTYGEDDLIAAAAGAHLAVTYSRLGEHAKAESLRRRSLNNAPVRGVATPPSNLLRLALARALIGQGEAKPLEGRELEAEVYRSWQPHQPLAQGSSKYGRPLINNPLPWAWSSSE